MTDNFFKDLPPHGKAKHEILTHYLKAYFPKLNKWLKGQPEHRRSFVYIDGFAGAGTYGQG